MNILNARRSIGDSLDGFFGLPRILFTSADSSAYFCGDTNDWSFKCDINSAYLWGGSGRLECEGKNEVSFECWFR